MPKQFRVISGNFREVCDALTLGSLYYTLSGLALLEVDSDPTDLSVESLRQRLESHYGVLKFHDQYFFVNSDDPINTVVNISTMESIDPNTFTIIKSLPFQQDSYALATDEVLELIGKKLSGKGLTIGQGIGEIQRDLHRTCYTDWDGPIEEIKRGLISVNTRTFSYAQGCYFGGVFTSSYIKITLRNSNEGSKFTSEIVGVCDRNGDKVDKDYFQDLGTVYIDQGVLCGASIAYMRDEDDLSIPVEKRRRPFAIAVIRNVTAAPDKRQVMYLSDFDLLNPTEARKGTGATFDEILPQLKRALGSKRMYLLFAELLHHGRLDMSAFNALQARITPDTNIDNCDEKREQLNFILSTCTATQPRVSEVDSEIKRNPNFYKTGVYEPYLERLEQTLEIDNQIKQYNDQLSAMLMKEDQPTSHGLLFESGHRVLKEVNACLDNPRQKPTLTELCFLRKVIDTATRSLTTPNLPVLESLSKQASGHESPVWKRLGVGLVALGVACLIAGIVVTALSGGVGLPLLIAGIAGFTLICLGAKSIHYGKEKGLAKSLSEFRAVAMQNAADRGLLEDKSASSRPSESPESSQSGTTDGNSPTDPSTLTS